MKTKKNHPYHLVDYSPWPLTGALGALNTAFGIILWFSKKDMTMMILGMTIILLTMFQWWRDIIRESTFQGNHTMSVMKSMKMGMILFILSEIMLFVSFFWAFIHSSVAPSIDIGNSWPPMGIKPLDPMQIPLLNTVMLLSSGISVTWAHHSIISSKIKQMSTALIMTVTMGLLFSLLQGYEYYESEFTMADSIYGSCFFMVTGLHGLHVMIGTIFLTVCLLRNKKTHFSKTHHLGFEMAAWYWHFVDLVWLFVYIIIYWWGS